MNDPGPPEKSEMDPGRADLPPLARLYACLLALLPPRFCDQFADEMLAVFAQALEEARQRGERAVWALMLRELLDLPSLALRERRLERSLPPYLPAQASQPRQWLRRPPQFLANLALVALWLFLFRPVYPYISLIFTRQEFRLNQFALLGVIGLLIYQVRRKGLGLHFGAAPALHTPAVALLLLSSLAFILAERVVDVNTLSASLFGLAFYGLLGLWLEPLRWRQGLPAALLLIATLPFGEHLQTFIGYPVRLITAALVRDGLSHFGIHTIGIDTILVFESGVSQIDLPCSGVKSLWTGGMFLLAATWIEQRKINRRWLLAALIFAFLLFAANLGRVAILVTTGPALGWNLLAEMLHVPLGVLGFAAACAALVWMLRRFVPSEDTTADAELFTKAPQRRPRWLLPGLMAVILLLVMPLHTPTAGGCRSDASRDDFPIRSGGRTLAVHRGRTGLALCRRTAFRQPLAVQVGSKQQPAPHRLAAADHQRHLAGAPSPGALLRSIWTNRRAISQRVDRPGFSAAGGLFERCPGALPIFRGVLAASARPPDG